MIDGPNTVDRDDAFRVQRDGSGWAAAVHIACVADIVPVGGPADRRAAQRKRTVYLPDRALPMLPRNTEHRATLHPNKPRPVITVTFHIGLDGIVSQTNITETTLTNPVAMDYAAATAAIHDPSHPHHAMLREAHDLAHVLLASRRDHGALVLYDLSHGLVNDGDSGLRHLDPGERHTAYMVVAELMIVANQVIAEFAVARDLPILFRNHQPAATAPPREQVLEELRLLVSGEAWRRDAAGERLGHLLRPAFYAPHASEHYGLRLPFYCHASSPLRRYADLLVQRQLLAALRGQTPPHDVDDLARHATQINTALARARGLRRERNAETIREQRRDTLADGAFAALEADEFHRVVKLAIAEHRHGKTLEAELRTRIADGRIQPRTAYHVLLLADQQWNAARAALINWLTAHPEHAVTIVAMHAQQAGLNTPHWDELPVGTVTQPLFSARTGITAEGHITWSATRIQPTKNTARQQAALSLIATLIEVDDPSTSTQAPGPAAKPTATTPERANAVAAINELTQRGALSNLVHGFTATGPAHAPQFTCTVHALYEPNDTKLTGSGTGTTKNSAKAEAFGDLYTQVTAACT